MQLQTRAYRENHTFLRPADAALDSSSTLVLAFGSSHLDVDSEPLRELRAALPTSHVIGCSTAGEIYGTSVSDSGLVVAIARLERCQLRHASADLQAGASTQAGASIARRLAAPDLRTIFVLSDGLQVNGSELVRGIHDVVGDRVVVSGGLAGDGARFAHTWVLHDGRPMAGTVTAVGIYGSALRVGHGSKGGWDIFGPERVITRSRSNVLYELDGKPALQLYKEYLGERAAGLPATALLFPLSVRAAAIGETPLVRTILAVDEAEQSLTFAGDVPQGALAQLMRANFDRLVQGASDAAQNALIAEASSEPVLSIAISCVGRRLVLGERTEEEIEATLDVLPPHAQQIGFYSYGEISPCTTGRCELHNQTMTITTLSESRA